MQHKKTLNQTKLLKTIGLLCILFFLVGCNGSRSPESTNYYVGREGLTLSFIEDFPPEEVYEQDLMPTIVLLENKGASTVEKLLVNFLYDPLYIIADVGEIQYQDPIYGRSDYYPEGDYVELELYENFETGAIQGMREAPKTNLGVLACYEYTTTYAAQICVDVDKFIRSGREQICAGENLRSSGQGAPVAFTEVEVKTTLANRETRMVRPDFIVDIENVGRGSVLGAGTTDYTAFEQTCKLKSDNAGSVSITGSIFGIELACNPQIVRLRDGKGTTRCTIPEERMTDNALFVQQNIYTTLVLEAKYVYRQSEFKEITLIRDPAANTGSYEGITNGIARGYVYENGELQTEIYNGQERPLTICRDYALNPNKAPNGMLVEFNEGYSCTCGVDTCLDMDGNPAGEGAFCARGLCPGSTECCNVQAYDDYQKALKEQERREQQEDSNSQENSEEPPEDSTWR